MTDNKTLRDEADYVVVGAGSAGAAAASRLAASGASVILLEAGKKDTSMLVTKPGMIGPMHADPSIKKRVDWGYYTVPQQHMNNRVIPQTRGKVVGGSSSINGLLWVRGNRANYDSWAAEGNTGWDADSVNETYRRVEDFEDGADEFRGAGGPIKVTRHTQPTEASLQFEQATADTLGVKILKDYNAAEQEGVSRFQQSAFEGKRYSSSRGYLTNTDWPTIQVQRAGPRPEGRHRERPRHRRRGRGQGRQPSRGPGRQGGHPLGRRVRIGADPDAVGRRPGGPPRRSRHRGQGRPAGGRQPARPPLRADDLADAERRAPRHPDLLRPRTGQGADPRWHRSWRTPSSRPWPSCVRRWPPTSPTCRSTCCRGRTRRPTRTHRYATRSTAGAR